MRTQKTARERLRLKQNPHFGKASWMRSNAGYDCSSASPHCQSLSAIKLAVPGPFLFRHFYFAISFAVAVLHRDPTDAKRGKEYGFVICAANGILNPTSRPIQRPKAPMARVIFVNRYFFPDHSATSQILSDLTFHLAAPATTCTSSRQGNATTTRTQPCPKLKT